MSSRPRRLIGQPWAQAAANGARATSTTATPIALRPFGRDRGAEARNFSFKRLEAQELPVRASLPSS